MKLETVFVRFYKSFNFDHLRKAHAGAKAKLWEEYEGNWFPYIEVPIDKEITTVVGANESGKSHLLSAIKKAITGKDIKQRDLCRYSPFFNVEKGRECWPHLGIAWADLGEREAAGVRSKLNGGPATFDRFIMFREGPDSLSIYIPDETGGFFSETLKGTAAHTFGDGLLPRPFEIVPQIALPNFVPLAWISEPTEFNAGLTSRSWRSNLIEAVSSIAKGWPSDQTQFTQRAPTFFGSLNPYFANAKFGGDEQLPSEDSLQLARSLLLRIANIEPQRLKDLSDAIRDGEDGHANALVAQINEQLAKRLNFPKWWVQDRDFSLRLTPREMDLVFTVRDRTGTEYTFSERSSGLKYFLSYLVQSQSHEREKDRPEILLMDEPDTYLSAEAQQDLLKIFDDFARPQSDVASVQVVFVTHSPFLIDKNHSERIRVLEKGKGLDGTRVIRNASQNHYEPLRSAFGAFVGETAFIGACNILVEGASDQIILAGIARLLRRRPPITESDTLDLNRLVLVPCGSATQIPYMIYLVRGRDAEKPPAIVLLDSDESGNAAAAILRGQDKKMRRLIRKEFVIQLADIFLGTDFSPKEIEDLIPSPLAVAATNAFLGEVHKYYEVEVPQLTAEEFSRRQANGEGTTFDIVNSWASANGHHVEKIGFARALVECCTQPAPSGELTAAIESFFARMRIVFRALNRQRRDAERQSLMDRVGSRVDRQQAIFLRDNPHQATKEQVQHFVENVEHVLDDTAESDAVRIALVEIRRKFQIDEATSELLQNYEDFKANLTSLKDAFRIQETEPA